MNTSFLQKPLTGTSDDLADLLSIGEGTLFLPESGISALISSIALEKIDYLVKNLTQNSPEKSQAIMRGLTKIKNHKDIKPLIAEKIRNENRAIISMFIVSMFQNPSEYWFLNAASEEASEEYKEVVEIKKQSELIERSYNDDLPELEKQSQALRVKIAKLCTKINAITTVNNFEILAIADPLERLEIVKICARKNPKQTAEHFKKFEIIDEADRFEIAKLCASNNGISVATFFARFNITDPKRVIEIALLCIKDHPYDVLNRLSSFSIKDEKDRIELAKFCAQEKLTAAYLPSSIKKFKIQDQTALIEIAKLCARQNGGGIAALITSLGIQDQGILIEIAKLCASNDGESTADQIANFGIKDQGELTEIAKLCAMQSGMTAAHITNFGIQNQAALTEIAKLCANQDGRATAEQIANFGIQDQAALIEIAKLCAMQSGMTAAYITNFGIQDQAALIEIAKLCANQDDRATAEQIANFGIQNQTALTEIAKLCALQSGMTAAYITNFGIQNQAVLIEIAKLCASNDGEATAENIRKFEIKDTAALIEIIKICFDKDFRPVRHLRDIKITEEADRYELALYFSSLYPSKGILVFDLFDLNDPHKESILMQCVQNDSECIFLELVQNMPQFATTSSIIRSSNWLKTIKQFILTNSLSCIALQESFKPIDTLLSIDEDIYSSLPEAERIKQIKEAEELQRKKLIHFIPMLWVMEKKLSVADWPKVLQLFPLILNYRRPDLKWPLIVQVIEGVQKGNFPVLPSLDEEWITLQKVLTVRLVQEGLPEDKLQAILEMVKQSKLFKDGKNQRALHEALLFLLTESRIDIEAKKQLFDKLIGPLPFKDEIQFLLRLKQLPPLGMIADPLLLSEKNNKTIAELLEVAFQLLPIGKIDNFGNGYAKTIQESRDPTALIRYIGKLKSLRDPALFNDLATMLKSIVTEQWIQNRHDLSKSSHLQKIGEKHPLLLDKWFSPCKSFLLSEATVSQNASKFSYATWLKEKLIHDRHIGEIIDQNPLLLALLNPSEETDQKSVRESIRAELPKILLANSFTALFSVKNPKEEISALKELLKQPKVSKSEFKKDIEARIESLKVSDKISIPDLSDWLKEKLLTQGHMGEDVLKNELLLLLLSASSKQEQAKFQAAIKNQLLSNRIVSLLGAKKPTEEMTSLQELLKLPTVQESEFKNDIDGRILALQNSQKESSEKAVVIDTEDWIELLLSGVEITGSCQRIDGNANLNKGLLGYLLDGKIRMLAIKDKEGPEGKLFARALLKLLWDGEKPVLFFERVYDNFNRPLHTKALLDMAKRKAKELGIPLLSLEGEGDLYPSSLQSLQGPASFEYSDGSKGVQKQGVYTIRDAKHVKD